MLAGANPQRPCRGDFACPSDFLSAVSCTKGVIVLVLSEGPGVVLAFKEQRVEHLRKARHKA